MIVFPLIRSVELKRQRRRLRPRRCRCSSAADHPGPAGRPHPTAHDRQASTSSHAAVHSRQTSAQSRQRSWWAACRSHSSSQSTHAAEQASIVARMRRMSGCLCCVAMRAVARQASAQSRATRITRITQVNSATSPSLRLASAQAVQLAPQSRHSSAHRRRTSRNSIPSSGCSSKIALNVIYPRVPSNSRSEGRRGCKGIATVPDLRVGSGSVSSPASRRAVRQSLITSALPRLASAEAPFLWNDGRSRFAACCKGPSGPNARGRRHDPSGARRRMRRHRRAVRKRQDDGSSDGRRLPRVPLKWSAGVAMPPR
jgi:hypothetical protein